MGKFNSVTGTCPKHGKVVVDQLTGKCFRCAPFAKKGLYYSSDVAAEKVNWRHAIEDHQERRLDRESEG